MAALEELVLRGLTPGGTPVVKARPPAAPGPFVLSLVGGPRAGTTLPLSRSRLVVGRLIGGLQLEEPWVAEGHASFFMRGDDLFVEDGGSASGVYVSTARHVLIAPGQQFACGRQVFRYCGPLAPPRDPSFYGAPLQAGAYRLEHLLVGGRSGRVVVFHHGLTIGRTDGALRFADDLLLDVVHAELKPGAEGMELITHSRNWPAFVRLPSHATCKLEHGALVLIGNTTLRVAEVPVARA